MTEQQEVFLKAGQDMVEALIEYDPPVDSPEGIYLNALAVAVEKYEQYLFPDLGYGRTR